MRGSAYGRARASCLKPLAIGRQRFDTVAVLISCGPLCDPQAHDSPVTRVVWSEGVVPLLKDQADRTHDAPILGSRAPADLGSATMRSRRRYQHNADELCAREFGSGRFGGPLLRNSPGKATHSMRRPRPAADCVGLPGLRRSCIGNPGPDGPGKHSVSPLGFCIPDGMAARHRQSEQIEHRRSGKKQDQTNQEG